MANSEDGKLEELTHKNSILILVDYQLSIFKSIGEGDDSSRKPTIVFSSICGMFFLKLLQLGWFAIIKRERFRIFHVNFLTTTCTCLRMFDNSLFLRPYKKYLYYVHYINMMTVPSPPQKKHSTCAGIVAAHVLIL